MTVIAGDGQTGFTVIDIEDVCTRGIDTLGAEPQL